MHQSLALPLKRFQPRRSLPGGLGTWSGHLPFAHDLVASVRPSLLVELGTHYGQSYFGFCQAVEENKVDCRCYAVDTWKDNENVFTEVSEYNRQNFPAFSFLLRNTFDEANAQFAPDSIDLLHVDGLPTFDAVEHAFDLWFPKVRPGGIILLHTINVRHADLEVWKLWKQLTEAGDHFEFTHSGVLGVLRKPGAADAGNGFLRVLFSAAPAEQEAIRDHYVMAAENLELRGEQIDRIPLMAESRRLRSIAEDLRFQNERLRKAVATAEELRTKAEEEAAEISEDRDDGIARCRAELADERNRIHDFLESYSWKLTKPMRIALHFAKTGSFTDPSLDRR